MDPGFYAEGVTYDTTEEAGAAPGCTDTLRTAWSTLITQAETGSNGLDEVSASMRVCPEVHLNNTADAYVLRDWAGAAFDMMAMGT